MSMTTESARLLRLGLNKYVREQIEPIFRKSYIMNQMRDRKRISFNNEGLRVEWRPRKRRRDISWGPGNPTTVDFPQENLWGVATLDWKTAYMGQSISEIERLALRGGESTFFKKQEAVAKSCIDDFLVRFGPMLYRDGVGTDKIEGFDSWSGTNSTVTNEPVGDPSDTWAGLSTALGAEGDWDAPSGGGWPRGGDSPENCDYEYCYFSPLVVDYNHADLVHDSDNETAGWDDCWIYACRYLTTYMSILQSKFPDVVILEADLLRRAKNSLKKDQQFQLTNKAKDLDPGIQELTFDGITFATEFGVPPGRGYALNWQGTEMMCLGDQLVKTTDDTDIVTADKLYRFAWHGLLWTETPAYWGFLEAISEEGT